MRPQSQTCINCSSKYCEKTENDTFDICQYGISFINQNNEIITKEPKVPLSTIAKNLRHEINPILSAIIQQATKLDPTLSTKKIDSKNPLSLIVGSTVVLDNFIQMIAGVHEFHSTPSDLKTKKIKLNSIIDFYHTIYGIVKEEGRTKDLKLNNLVPHDIYITECSDFIKYSISVLIDNAWKYSINNSTLTASIFKLENGNYRLILTNKSKTIPDDINIFDIGTKVDQTSKGFGYGLNWIRTLEINYNILLGNIQKNEKFRITHEQTHPDKGLSFQEFILDNIKIERE